MENKMSDADDYIMKCDAPIYEFIEVLGSPLASTVDGTGKCRFVYRNVHHDRYYASAVPPKKDTVLHTGNYIRWNWDAVWLKNMKK